MSKFPQERDTIVLRSRAKRQWIGETLLQDSILTRANPAAAK